MYRVVVHIVVVTNVERSTRTRRPPGKKLSAHSRIERVVIDDRAREVGFRELIRTAPSPDVDIKGGQASVVSHQTLFI